MGDVGLIVQWLFGQATQEVLMGVNAVLHQHKQEDHRNNFSCRCYL